MDQQTTAKIGSGVQVGRFRPAVRAWGDEEGFGPREDPWRGAGGKACLSWPGHGLPAAGGSWISNCRLPIHKVSALSLFVSREKAMLSRGSLLRRGGSWSIELISNFPVEKHRVGGGEKAKPRWLLSNWHSDEEWIWEKVESWSWKQKFAFFLGRLKAELVKLRRMYEEETEKAKQEFMYLHSSKVIPENEDKCYNQTNRRRKNK